MAQTSIINSANDYYLRDLLNPDSLLKYVIPKYQREYSWRKPQWAALYDDIMGESGSKPHFLGTVIAISGDDAIHPQLELVEQFYQVLYRTQEQNCVSLNRFEKSSSNQMSNVRDVILDGLPPICAGFLRPQKQHNACAELLCRFLQERLKF